MRGFVLGLVVGLALTVAAQEAPKKVEVSPGDKCLTDLPQWQQYAQSLKASRDQLEQALATTTAEATVLRTQLAEAKKKP